MIACKYEISLLVFNSTSHSFAALIPNLLAPIYYSLFLNKQRSYVKKLLERTRFFFISRIFMRTELVLTVRTRKP